jgi:DNA-directed RNA polymerase specialized sigma24 family protein
MAEDKQHIFKNADEVVNYMAEKNSDADNRKNVSAKKAKQPITTAMPDDRKAYLIYCASFLKDRRAKALLNLRIMGASHREIAQKFNVPVGLVQKLEIEALKKAKEVIKKVKNNPLSVPLVGGGKIN